MPKYDRWTVEEYAENGTLRKTHQHETIDPLHWTPGEDHRRTAERVAEDLAREITDDDDLLDHRDNFRRVVHRLAVRPRDLPDEAPVRVMVDVEAVVRSEARGSFTDKEWSRAD